MTTRIKLRRDTAANWNAADPVLALGEPGYDTTNNKLKIGDGVTAWQDLDYLTDETGGGPGLGNFTIDGDILEADQMTIRTNDADLNIESDSDVFVKSSSGDHQWQFSTTGDLTLPEGGDILDSNGASVLGGGGGVTGLLGNDNFNPQAEGDEKYRLEINEDIDLKIYQSGEDAGDFGPGFSLGSGIGADHRSGVVAIGNNDVGYNSLPGGVYIGCEAGWNDNEGPQGLNSIAIGFKAARNFTTNNSITLNATGNVLDPTGSGLFVKPIQSNNSNTTNSLYYNAATGEVTYASPTAASLDSFKIDGNYLGTVDDPDTGGWGGYNMYLDPGGESNAGIYIPSISNQEGGSSLQIYNNYGQDNDIQLMVDGGTFEFRGDGTLAIPGDIVNDEGNSVLDPDVILTDDKEIRVTVGNSEYFAIVNRANNNDNGVESSAVEYDSNDNMVMLHISQVYENAEYFNRLIISKYTSTGNLLWQKQIQENIGANTQDADISQGHDIVIDNSNNILVIYNQNNAVDGDDSLVVIKLNGANGNEQWKKLYYPGAGTFVEAAGSATDGTHTYIAARYNTGDDDITYLIKIVNSNGDLVWAESVQFTEAEPDEAYGMDLDGAGGLVVVGAAKSAGPTGGYVAKFSVADGSHIWTRIFADIGVVNCTSGDVVVDSQNNIFVSLNSRQEIVHDDNNNFQTTIAHILKLDSTGDTQWIRRVGPGPCASVGTGIDCDSNGNVYLSALTVAQDRPTREVNDWGNTARSVLAIAKYSTTGTVLWQRYIDPVGYWFYQSKDNGDGPPGFYDYDANSGRNLSVGTNGKLAVQVTAKQKDPDGSIWNSNLWESVTFQIDQDGREMTIGSGNEQFSVKASRIPGKFIDIPELVEGSPYSGPTVTDLTANVEVSTPTITYADGELGNQISKSESYEYVFGNDGTLTIPNDGDIKLTQTQRGWFSIYGPANNYNNDIWIRANCVDPNTGDVYVVGNETTNDESIVARYDSTGQIIWSIKLYDDDNGNNSRANAVVIHPDTGNLIVLVEYYGAEDNTAIVEIDPDTAKVLNSTGVRDTGNDSACQGYDLAIENGTGRIAVVGRKFDEYRGWSTMPVAGSTVGIMFTARAGITGTPNTGWYVSGTDITGRTPVDSVNRYPGLTTTTRQGSGAMFAINDNQDGTYSISAIQSAGTNYLAGHKIKIPGTSLGGTTPANDATITITGITGEGEIDTASISGTASGGAPGYTNVTGDNFEVGSGCIMTLEMNTDGTPNGVYAFTAAGTNYVVGDVITVSGTQFVGGTSPANDITMTVTDNSGGGVGGVVGTGSITGSAPTTYWRIQTTSQTPDFSNEGGSWSLLQPLGGEAFVVVGSIDAEGDFNTEWSQVLSGGDENDNDRYFSVAYDASNNLYAAGEMRARNNAAGAVLNNNWCAVVSKFDSSGNQVWTKALNTTDNDAYAKCVVVRGNTVVVSHYESYYTVITKLDTNSNIKWQRRTDSNDDSSVAIDTNGDIYAVMESNFENRYEDIIKVLKFESNGEIEWRKFFGTLTYEYGGTHEYFKNGRNLTIDADHMYISGYTTAFDNNYESGFLVKIPKTGDADGAYGAWSLLTETYDVTKITSTEFITFEPIINTGDFEDIGFVFVSNWFDPTDGDNYYQTLEEIVDRDGGAIEFADGTRQTTSAQMLPQVKVSNGADHRLKLEDMGKHIFVTNTDTSIIIPYNYDVALPVGFRVFIINDNGASINVDTDGGSITIRGGSITSNYWNVNEYGIATLIKVDTDYWYIGGDVTVE